MASKSLIGQTIGKYQIVEHLGRGGMAEVYKAYQESLDRYVALKLMHAFLADEEDFLSRFRREARAMASLNHNNIVIVYDFDVQDGDYYIVMELVSGGTLKQQLENLASRGERLSLARAVKIVLEIADALAYAHSRGMVHRDIKPANIMLSGDGRAVLTDFGIAKILSGPSFTATGAMIGTPAYMSPEQGLGQPGDERSDLYALGVLFYQMVTGRLPFDADTPLAVIMKHVNNPVPPPLSLNAELPPEIHDVILKALEKNPDERYQTAHEFAKALREAVRSSNIELAAALPAELLQDRPTPLPRPLESEITQPRAEATVPSAGATVVAQRDKTRVATASVIAETEVGAPVRRAREEKRRGRGWLIGAGVLGLLVIAVAVGAGIVIATRASTPEPTATIPLVVAEPTDTEVPATATAGEPTEPAVTTVDIGATAEAIVAAALTSAPTDTPQATPTKQPTFTPTPDVTATFLASCEVGIELVDSYTYQNQQFDSAPVSAAFPINWIIRNSGTCTLSEGVLWSYQSGEQFEQAGPLALEQDLAPGEETTLRMTFVAPDQPGTYESTWLFLEEDGAAVGPTLTFAVGIYVPATPTPIPPTPTVTPAASPTGEITAVGFNFFPDNGCEYPGGGSEWRCAMIITPFGGGGGPYTIWVFDSEPPARYGPGGNETHFITARRCAPWIHEIKVQDEVTGNSISRNIAIDPTTLSSFPGGGCVLP